MRYSASEAERRSEFGPAALAAVTSLLLVIGAVRVGAATLLVSPSGSDAGNCQVSACRTVAYALTQAAASGDTVALAAGTYVENVVVNKSVVLVGAGQGSTTLVPALSGPTCGAPEPQPSLCAGSSSVLVVQADNVEISDLTVDGNNPGLTSGVTGGGVDLDARNGIITNHNAGVFNGLAVHDTTVRNVYLRGFYASSGGTFAFTHDTVENVQAGYYSICMFNFGGSGTMSGNTATGCSDAISSNWSTGIQFRNNVVTDSDSAVHSDNAQGPTPDVIDGNWANNLHAGTSYAFWVFAPAVAPTVSNNTVTGTAVGLGAFGTGSASVPFEGNVVDCQGQAGSIGAWVSTTLFGYGSRDAQASLQGNRISNCATGVQLQAEPTFATVVAAAGNTVLRSTVAGVALDNSGAPGPGTYSVTLDHNRIFGNAVGLSNPTGQALSAQQNWWGCDAGPGGSGALGPCDTVSGTATFAPWLVLAPPAVTPPSFDLNGGSATVTTDVAHDSTSAASSPGVPDQTPVAFSTTIAGAALTPVTAGTVGGAASSTLTSTLPGSGTVCAAVDNERLCSAAVTVTGVPVTVPLLGVAGLAGLAVVLAALGVAVLRR